jgi:hypothetical protein
MNKILLNSIIAVSIILPVVALGWAAPTGEPTANFTDISALGTKIGTFLWQLAALIALVMFIIAGIMMMTAGGAAEKMTTARQMAIYGVIGLVVAILGFSIVAIVSNAVA